MKIQKILEAAKTVALDNLIPPEVTVITRDRHGHIQLWWMEGLSAQSANMMASKAYDQINLSHTGHWLASVGSRIKCESLGRDVVAGVPMCRKYSVIERRLGTDMRMIDEDTFANSSFVSGLLQRISNMDTIKDEQPAAGPVDNYEIKTAYQVDGITFDTKDEAEHHVAISKLFDLIVEGEPDANYMDYQTAIETLLKNKDRVKQILGV